MEFNPYSPQLHEDPYPVYAELRRAHPAYYNADLKFWALSRYDDVLSALQQPAVYSSAEGIVIGTPPELVGRPPMMIMMDPPRHTQLRALVNKAFTPRRIAGLEPRIRRIVTTLIDDFVDSGRCDLVRQFSGPLPTIVIAELLGVPPEDQEFFKDRSNAMVSANLDLVRGDPSKLNVTPILELGVYLKRVYDERRAQPKDDLMSALLAAEIEGQRLSDEELIGFALMLLVAGNETTTNLISNAAVLFDHHPEQRLRLIADSTAIPAAVEECLRFDSPVQGLARTLRRDVTLHGQTLREGEKVLLLFGSANRDPAHFEDPDRFDVARQPTSHLAFGLGTHFCLGASLARLEARVAFEELLARLPDYRVGEERPKRLHSGPIRGLLGLGIEFTANRASDSESRRPSPE